MDIASSGRQTSQSSIRLIKIMECLANSGTPMRLRDIAKFVGTTQSTVLRYLYAMEDAKYVYQDKETSRYALTWRICALSEKLNTSLGLRNITNSFVIQLANTFSLGACLVIEGNSEGIYLDCIDSPNSPTLQRIGKKAPLHATGSGKILLSRLSDRELTNYLSEIGLEKYTANTITDPAVLRKELEKVRRLDYAIDDEECEIGLRCISCPIRDYTGQIIAAMSMFGSTADLTDDRAHTSIYPALKAATDTISSRLGFS